LFGVGFDAGNELPKSMLREAREHGWAVAGASAYPTVVQMDADGVVRPVVAGDYVFATALLRALAGFFERHADVWRHPPARPARFRLACEDLAGKPAVSLAAPHPGAYWRWGWESLTEHHLLHEAGDIVRRFVARSKAPRAAAAIGQETRVVAELLRFKIRVVGQHPLDWHPKLVDRYLTDYLPREGDVRADDIDATPAILDAFFVWLGESHEEDADAVARIRAGIERLTPAFLREARKPENFSAIKKLTAEVRAAGIPAKEKRRLAALIKARAPILAAEQAQRSLFEPEATSASARKPWVWTPGTPPPDPKGACPCGSSSRYKRCCMPR
jgi:uncharacterized protein YchJ